MFYEELVIIEARAVSSCCTLMLALEVLGFGGSAWFIYSRPPRSSYAALTANQW